MSVEDDLIAAARIWKKKHGMRVRGSKAGRDLFKAVERYEDELRAENEKRRQAAIGKWYATPNRGWPGYRVSWRVCRDEPDDLGALACIVNAKEPVQKLYSHNEGYAKLIAGLLNAHEQVRGEPLPTLTLQDP